MSSSLSIPKMIHYCWFGKSEISSLGKKCIESWRCYLPDFEIIEWNENSFNVDTVPFTREKYRLGEYAFVSDYVRFWALYHYGGLYFDTDVELIKPIEHILREGPFMGTEHKNPMNGVNSGLGMGAYPGMSIFKEILDIYNCFPNGLWSNCKSKITVVKVTTSVLSKYGLSNVKEVHKVAGINIYPQDFFCPIYYGSRITDNTVSIHYFAGSWLNRWGKIKKSLRTILPSFITDFVYKLKYGN